MRLLFKKYTTSKVLTRSSLCFFLAPKPKSDTTWYTIGKFLSTSIQGCRLKFKAQKQGLPQHPESLELEIVLLQSVQQFWYPKVIKLAYIIEHLISHYGLVCNLSCTNTCLPRRCSSLRKLQSEHFNRETSKLRHCSHSAALQRSIQHPSHQHTLNERRLAKHKIL